MLRYIKKILNLIDYSIEKIVSYSMGMLILAVSLQILYRFIIVKFTGRSFPYTDEFSRVILIWICYLIIAVGLKEGIHTSFNLLIESLPTLWQKLIYLFNHLLILIFSIIIIVQGLKLMELTSDFKTPTMQISVAWLYAAPTVGCLFVGLRAIIQIVDKLISSNSNNL